MKRWDCECKSFRNVRKLLKKESPDVSTCLKIMNALEDCCDELTPNENNNWEFYESFRDMKSDIHEEIEYMGDDYEDCERTVDNFLAEFYDLCDFARVWLCT